MGQKCHSQRAENLPAARQKGHQRTFAAITCSPLQWTCSCDSVQLSLQEEDVSGLEARIRTVLTGGGPT